MGIIKFKDFIAENLNDTPESYISMALKKLKIKLDKIFDGGEPVDSEMDETGAPTSRGPIPKVGSDKITLKELGVYLESSDISKYSSLYDSLTIKFSDAEFTYTMIIMIDIKEGIPSSDNENGEFSASDIKKCYVKFKKYDLENFDLIGQIDKNINIEDIDEDFLIELKIEIDDEYGDSEEFEIET
jgi:hypothetical protein